MLKKPFRLLEKRENNAYYFLQVGNEQFIAVESLFIWGKKGEKEFTQNLRLLPLSTPLLRLFLEINQIKNTTQKNQFGYSEKRYEKINFDAFRQSLIAMREQALIDNAAYPWEFTLPDTAQNATISALQKEGNVLLCFEKSGHSAVTYLVGWSRLGALRVFEVQTAGRSGFDVTISLSTLTLDAPLIQKIMTKLEKTQKRRN